MLDLFASGRDCSQDRLVPRRKLDDFVTEPLSERPFHPERLTAILVSVAEKRDQKALGRNSVSPERRKYEQPVHALPPLTTPLPAHFGRFSRSRE